MGKKKKIVIISPYQFRLNRGIETFVFYLAKQLCNDDDLKVIIYSWADKSQNNHQQWNAQITIRKVPYARYFQEILAKVFYKIWIFWDKPQSTLLNFLFHGEQCLPKKICYIYILHYPFEQVPERYEFIKKAKNRFSKLKFVAVSEFVKSQAKLYLGLKDLDVIPHGIDLVRFSPPIKKNKRNKGLRIVSITALEERKGIQFAIKGLSLLREKNIHYDIYGEGKYRETIEKLIKEEGLEQKVTLHGSTQSPEKVLKEADIFCLLSKGEASSLSLLESMASGLPAIVSQYEPFGELILDDYALRVERENSRLVADAIEKLSDENERKKFGIKARKIAENKFSYKMMANKYQELILKTCNEKLVNG